MHKINVLMNYILIVYINFLTTKTHTRQFQRKLFTYKDFERSYIAIAYWMLN